MYKSKIAILELIFTLIMITFFILVSCCFLGQIYGKTNKPALFIFNGQRASLGDFPWMAALVYTGDYTCGGSLISKYWILTAAHCVYQRYPQDFRIHLGVTRREDSFNAFAVHSIVIHPLFNPVTLSYDAGVLRLQQSVAFSYNIRPILLESRFVGSGIAATISGWGRYSEDWLRFITVQTITNRQCESLLYGRLDYSKLCVLHYGSVVKSACPGDSGSPVVYGWGSANPAQIGIVSEGDIDCTRGEPKVKTRISTIRQWLTQITGV